MICLSIILAVGIYTGVTTGLLLGSNIEDLRRTSEIGIGFIRDIPILIVYLSLLMTLFISNESELKKLKLSLFIAFLLFISVGHKIVIMNIAVIHICYLCIKYRGLKLYEYIAYLYLIPIGSVILNSIRQGRYVFNLIDFGDPFISNIFFFKVNTVRIIEEIENQNLFLKGMEFLSGAWQIIPRFLWANKPLSYDYFYKDLIGYDFEGGGTPINGVFMFYTNFENFFWLFYIIWLIILLQLYKELYKPNISIFKAIFLLLCFLNYTNFPKMLFYSELMLIIIFIHRFIYKDRSIYF